MRILLGVNFINGRGPPEMVADPASGGIIDAVAWINFSAMPGPQPGNSLGAYFVIWGSFGECLPGKVAISNLTVAPTRLPQ